MSPQTSGPKDWWVPRDWAEEQALRVAKTVRLLREHGGEGPRSAQWLADRTKELGHEISRSVIADLENGRRRHVTCAELIMLAAALEITPLELLYPDRPDHPVEYWPGQPVMTLIASRQFVGQPDWLASLHEQLRELARAIGGVVQSEGEAGGG